MYWGNADAIKVLSNLRHGRDGSKRQRKSIYRYQREQKAVPSHDDSSQKCDKTQQVRTFNDFDEEKLEIKPHDGASLEPKYIPPKGSEVTDLDQSTKSYQGSCHCGKVTFNLQSKPLEDIELTSCNCSICSRVCLRSPSTNIHFQVN